VRTEVPGDFVEDGPLSVSGETGSETSWIASCCILSIFLLEAGSLSAVFAK
jgi:hypothetical protein